MKAEKKKVAGQLSWRLTSDQVDAWVTVTGGQLAPVTFDRKGRKIQPYSVSPWAEERLDPANPPLINALRGDFFCMPFGANETPYRGEEHPIHGETANSRWKFENAARNKEYSCLHLSLQTKTRPGRVDKRLFLRPGQNVVYSQHVISDMTGTMDMGHHATLEFPDHPGSGRISTSKLVHRQVYVEPTEDPVQGGYSILKAGATFRDLESVPMITGERADLSRYPARRGFEDIAILVNDPKLPLAWTAVTFAKERYVWLALKDPQVLASTLMWMSNGGRHYAPWSSRHVNIMGLEDITAYFHYGLAESARANGLSKKGYRTSHRLSKGKPFTVNYIMAAFPVPAGFDRVAAVEPNSGAGLTLTADSGKTAALPVDLDFLEAAPGAWAG